MRPTLHELQTRLQALIAGTAGERRDLAAEQANLGIRGDQRMPAVDRVQVYAEMYVVRLRDALAHDYPALHRALGDDGFAALSRGYVAEHPSDRPSLRDLGRHLPAFAYRHPELLGAPWHAELAQLEWALVEAFDALDQRPLRAADLEGLPAEAWPELRLEPVRSLVLLACLAPVDLLHERLLAGDDVSELAGDPVLLRVWRQDTTVFQRRMDTLEAAALHWIFAGAPFAALCAWLGGQPHQDDPAQSALGLMRRWLDDELLVAPI
jgi:hypothetical protein